MEKLIALLNEYEKSSFEKDTNWVYEGEEWEYYEPNNRIIKGNWENKNILTRFELCSKQFGFIKWLVENDKIDRSKVLEEIGSCIKISGLGPHYSFYSALLMILAVSDTPIEDLISYLK